MGSESSLIADHDPARRLSPADGGHASAAADAQHVSLQAHRCGNCDAVLSGPYCANCGQHAHASARNLAAVLHDGWHDLTHVDGRLWLTMWLLLSRPGRLTVDYFHDRRARYLPPVRLYLVLSLVFFSFNLGTELDHRTAGHATPGTVTDRSAAGGGETPSSPATAHSGRDLLLVDDDAAASAVAVAKSARDAFRCNNIEIAGFRSLEQAVREACPRILDDGGAAFSRTLLHNVPKMMFVFLPLMAGIMRLLYWRPTRYYVEHLVFLLHNHCALFLCFALLSLVGMLGNAWSGFSVFAELAEFAGTCYVVWYPYAALRRYYAQARWLTAAKFVVIGCAYFVCLLLTLLGTAIVTALNA